MAPSMAPPTAAGATPRKIGAAVGGAGGGAVSSVAPRSTLDVVDIALCFSEPNGRIAAAGSGPPPMEKPSAACAGAGAPTLKPTSGKDAVGRSMSFAPKATLLEGGSTAAGPGKPAKEAAAEVAKLIWLEPSELGVGAHLAAGLRRGVLPSRLPKE